MRPAGVEARRMRLPIEAQASLRLIASEGIVEDVNVGNLPHAIVKNKEKDQQLHLIAITRRLLYCFPLPDEE